MPPTTLSTVALKNLLETNDEMRNAALEVMLERSREQIVTDGIIVIKTPELVGLVDSCFDNNICDEVVVKTLKKKKIPLSAELVKRVFEEACVDPYHRQNQPNSKTKISAASNFRKRKRESGLVNYYYCGEPEAVALAKAKALDLGVCPERIAVHGECMLEVSFQSPLLPLTPPQMVVADDDGNDSD